MRLLAGKLFRPSIIGLVVLALFAVSVVFAFNATSGVPWQNRTTVKAAFSDVGSLRVGDDVRINGARVGEVSSIDLVGMQPVVTMQLDSGQKVYRDASASAAGVGARSALGQKYVDLKVGNAAAGPFGSHDVIPPSHTMPDQELSDVLNVFDPPTRQALGSTVRSVGGGSAGHSRDLHDAVGAAPGTLKDLGFVSRTVGGKTDLPALLRSADRLAGRFRGHEQELSSLESQTDATLRAVGTKSGKPLNDTLRGLPGTLRNARTALDSLQPPLQQTESAAAQLKPGATGLGAATPDIRGVLREGVDPLNKVPGVAHQAVPAITDLTGVIHDARPLVPQVARALNSARPPLQTVAPYSAEASLWFTYARDALKDGDAAGHWLRMDVLANTESASGIAPLPDPVTNRNPYPRPGEAQQQKRTTIGGNR